MPKSRWSTVPRDITVTDAPDLIVSVPLLLDGVKVATLRFKATDAIALRLDVLTEPDFVGLVDFQAWEHPAGGS